MRQVLTEDELHEVVNHLTVRHSWYMDNLTDPEMRFKGLCAEVGINPENLVELIDFLLTSHTRIPPTAILEDAPFIVQTMTHCLWAGIEIGKKIAEVTMGDTSGSNGFTES